MVASASRFSRTNQVILAPSSAKAVPQGPSLRKHPSLVSHFNSLLLVKRETPRDVITMQLQFQMCDHEPLLFFSSILSVAQVLPDYQMRFLIYHDIISL